MIKKNTDPIESFSWEVAKEWAILQKIAKNKIQAKLQHSDLKLKHPDWCRDANKNEFTVLEKVTRDETKKRQDAELVHRQKNKVVKK